MDSPATMPKTIAVVDMMVTAIEFFSPTLYLLSLRCCNPDEALPPSLPGQFVEILVTDCDGVFLRRPISIYAQEGNTIDLLVQAVGRATIKLSRATVGDVYSVVTPLGNSFPMPSGSAPLLIGGGVGVAPIISLGIHLKRLGVEPLFLLGGRGATSFPSLGHLEGVGRLCITTEDGACGEQGYVTDHSVLREGDFSEVYTCGPTPMMRAVVAWSRSKGLNCYASLENMMACGMGVCLCCTEATLGGHRSVCLDGPVFDTKDLLW